jgi:surface antigen
MLGRAKSYTGVGNRRQSLGACAILILAAFTSGCTSLGERTSGRLAAKQAAPVSAIERVDPSDWETIRRTVAAASDAASHTLTWRNPDTGSNGTIALLPAISKKGSLCRAFATTVSDPSGIHRYGGEACLRTDGRWQLHDISADDVLVS